MNSNSIKLPLRRFHSVSTHCAEVVAIVVTAAVGVRAVGEAGVAAENDDSPTPCQAVVVAVAMVSSAVSE